MTDQQFIELFDEKSIPYDPRYLPSWFEPPPKVKMIQN